MIEIINPIEENSTAQGKLIYVSPVIGDKTITAKAIAELDNAQGKWCPGSFVKVSITTNTFDSPLVVPLEAIQKIDGCDCVFVRTSEGFGKRPVKLGLHDHKNVEIQSGLAPGEQYAANQTFLLKAEMNKDSIEDD